MLMIGSICRNFPQIPCMGEPGKPLKINRVTRMFANQDHRNDVGVDQDPRNDVGVDEDHGNDVGVDQDHRNVCELLMPFRVTRGNS